MTDQLDGRDLDRACAEAMGWTAIADGFYKGELLGRKPGCEEDGYLLPLYSTDPSTLPETLVWIRSQVDELSELMLEERSKGEWLACVWDDRETPGVRGATITEVAARLVVAVAKAKKEQGN